MGYGRALKGVVLRGVVLRGVVLGTLALALGLLAPSPVSACRPSTGDLIRERIGRGGTTVSVRADRSTPRQTKAAARQRRFGGAPHHAPAPPPVAQRPGSSSDKFEGHRNDGRRTRDVLAIVASARRGSAGASRKSTTPEDLLTTAPSAVFYEANAPPVRPFAVAGS